MPAFCSVSLDYVAKAVVISVSVDIDIWVLSAYVLYAVKSL